MIFTNDMNKSRYKRNSTILCLWMFICIAPLFAGEPFPKPPELQDNVDFWVHIYSIYTQDDVVIHDSEHMDIVYQVVNLNDFTSKTAGPRERWKVINTIVREYRDILTAFARTDHIDYAQLTDKERYVYLLWVENNDPDKYAKAIANIRGQRGLADNFKMGLQRSGKYIPEFKRIFTSYQLPEELCYLPHVESSFTNFAFSKSSAVGLWQFMRTTGRLYLKINNVVDERLDPYIATDAAARLLRNNYQELQSWPLAITAYNHGVNGMARAKKQFGTKNFGTIVHNYKSRTFGFASRNFYSEFLAATWVVNHSQFYFDSLAMEEPEQFTSFIVPENIKISNLADRLSLSNELISEYNPGLRAPVIHSQCDIPRGYKIRLPYIEDYQPNLVFAGTEKPSPALALLEVQASQEAETNVKLDTIFYLMPEKEVEVTDNAESYWTFNNGIATLNKTLDDILYSFSMQPFTGMLDTTGIALEYHLPILALLDEELITPVESKLVLPPVNIISDNIAAIETVPIDTILSSVANALPIEDIEPTDNVPMLASNPVNAINEENSASSNVVNFVINSGELYGPELPQDYTYNANMGTEYDLQQVFNFDITDSHWIKVLPEETLGHYADWLHISAQYLRKINRLQYQQEIKVGQQIKLAFVHVSEQEFYQKRMDYHKEIQQQFFSTYHITGTTTYEIQPGDNIWKICNQKFNIPYWLVAYYNQNVKWNLLKPGDAINIPIINPYAARNENNYDS